MPLLFSCSFISFAVGLSWGLSSYTSTWSRVVQVHCIVFLVHHHSSTVVVTFKWNLWLAKETAVTHCFSWHRFVTCLTLSLSLPPLPHFRRLFVVAAHPTRPTWSIWRRQNGPVWSATQSGSCVSNYICRSILGSASRLVWLWWMVHSTTCFGWTQNTPSCRAHFVMCYLM